MDHPIDPAVAPLFRPFPFGRTTLANRFAMAPMTRSHSPGGVPGADVVEYYRRRAEGGVGLIITEGTTVGHPGSNGYPKVPAFHGEAALEGWRRVADAVHEAGGRIIPQLWHVGLVRRPGMEPDPAVPGFGPLAIEQDGVEVVKAMTQGDIEAVIEAFADAAHEAERLGFDGIELHGAHEYLMDAFFWAKTNQRDDAYGGSLENRARLAVEVVRAVRQSVSRDFPVVFRFSQWKLRDFGARLVDTPEELSQLLTLLTEAGVDIFHASTRRFWEPAFDGAPDTLAALTRRITGRPVMTVGSVGLNKPLTFDDPHVENADLTRLVDGLEHEEFDLVALGRVLLSDPEWVEKVRSGRRDAIRSFTPDAMATLVV